MVEDVYELVEGGVLKPDIDYTYGVRVVGKSGSTLSSEALANQDLSIRRRMIGKCC